MTRYRIVPERSRVWIDARSSLHPVRTTADGLEGFIDLAGDDDGAVEPLSPPAGQLSLLVDRLSSGNLLEDRELRNRADTRRFPRIRGVLTGMERTDGEHRYRVRGDLEFRGVTRPCEDEMVLEVVDEDTVRLEGASMFDIRDFGMEPPRLLLLRVHPEVVVRVEIFATRDDMGSEA